MSFEDREAQLGLLLTQMQNEPRDKHELYLQIRQKLAEFRALGMRLPEDLVEFEKDLEAEFANELRDIARSNRIAEFLRKRAAKWAPKAG